MLNLEVTPQPEENLEAVIARAVHHLISSQDFDGAWTDCFDTGEMADAQTVIALHLLGVSDEEWLDALLNRIEMSQRPDGSWTVYPGDDGDLSTTVDCYYALQLSGRWKLRPAWQRAAEKFILRKGGLKRTRNLTKTFLAVGGEIPWSWLPSPGLYGWMFAKHSPVQIWDLVTFTRLHVPQMLILSSKRYVSEFISRPVLSHLTLAHSTTFMSHSSHSRKQRTVRNLKQSRTPWYEGRLARAFEFILQEREVDGTLAGYHSSTFLLLFVLQASGCPVVSPEISTPLRSLRRNLYPSPVPTSAPKIPMPPGPTPSVPTSAPKIPTPPGPTPSGSAAHQQTCDAKVWNTALALHAYAVAGGDTRSLAYHRGKDYLLGKQQSAVSGWVLKSAVHPGAWGFSSNNTKHPDTDDTVACLRVLFQERHEYEDSWWKGVDWLLSMQNRDGGWSAFERNSDKWWLERIPANDMKRAMWDPSTPDITGTVLEFIARHHIVPIEDVRVRRAMRWLYRHQERDGSWFGRWGSTYLYGTWCAIRGLVAAQVSGTARPLQRAKEWLLAVQQQDGSFAESCESDLVGTYVPWHTGVPSQTAWGLDALVYLIESEEAADERWRLIEAAGAAAKWLMQHSRDGEWSEVLPTGSAFPGSLHIRYGLYPKVWPIVALSHYRELLSASEGR